ncbi:MAG TPA: Gfo/Idh/MocA family oxidoreductase [Bryobacteraceae bacterium]|nr:Gfo/Idh/MocA family oxidoreductase [Bryobacteraceae bacterium]
MQRRAIFPLLAGAPAILRGAAPPPLRLAVIGLVHGHAGGFLHRIAGREDLKLVGIAEPRSEVRLRYAGRYSLGDTVFYADTERMLDVAKPDAVAIFTDTVSHLAAVEACAARKMPCMMEKPLAVSVDHARRIQSAAAKAGIPVFVNYETTWYRSHQALWKLAKEEKQLGALRKFVVHDGHQGPKAINVQPEFFEWLNDPERNGAGAMYDFGCYGANLCTWLLDNRRPKAVTCVAQRIQPSVYTKVEDEATIVADYGDAQAIFQASWNWPFNRKDIEVYGETGYAIALDPTRLRTRLVKQSEQTVEAPPIAAPDDDVVHYLATIARGQMKPSGLSSVENNLIVTEILEAARRSAREGRTIRL